MLILNFFLINFIFLSFHTIHQATIAGMESWLANAPVRKADTLMRAPIRTVERFDNGRRNSRPAQQVATPFGRSPVGGLHFALIFQQSERVLRPSRILIPADIFDANLNGFQDQTGHQVVAAFQRHRRIDQQIRTVKMDRFVVVPRYRIGVPANPAVGHRPVDVTAQIGVPIRPAVVRSLLRHGSGGISLRFVDQIQTVETGIVIRLQPDLIADF